MRFIDLTGKKFGKLTVLNQEQDYIQVNGRHRSRQKCVCECGNECIVDGDALRTGNTKSCGCSRHKKWAKDLTGQHFGKLTVLGRSSKYLNQKVYWHCKCDCGNEVDVIGALLTSGRSKSCGCSHITQGGFGKSRLYEVWFAMMSRCTKTENKAYQDYGGRGIKVCDEWKDFLTFRDWAYANGYDKDAPIKACTIDRIDTTGNYCPENCRWTDWNTQANNRTACKYITIDGVTHDISEWGHIMGISKSTIRGRLKTGWSESDAIMTPVWGKRKGA